MLVSCVFVWKCVRNCPAVTAGALNQAEIDARRYNGVKESRLHLQMKEWLVRCLSAD